MIPKKLFPFLVATLVIIVSIIAWSTIRNFNRSSIFVQVTPANATIHSITGAVFANNKTTPLKTGTYTISVSAANYISQKQTIHVSRGKLATITINLKIEAQGTIQQALVTDVYKTTSPSDISILKSNSFEGGDWIVALVQTTSDPASVVLKRNSSDGAYTVYLGPGTSFDPSSDSITQLPTDVQKALGF